MRHHQNRNLHLHHESSYLGLPVQTQRGPLIAEYLDRLYLTMQRALNQHPRTFAFRVDLRFPTSLDVAPYLDSNSVLGDFLERFEEKIKHNREMAKKKNKHAHDTRVRYVWAREMGNCGRPHFHLVIFLNNDAFSTLGDFRSSEKNIFNRLNEAWASALGLPESAVTGLVHIPICRALHKSVNGALRARANGCYKLHRDDPAGWREFFEHASYLCKSETKIFGDGCHSFGYSRC
jgi:hypothetical protein